MKLSQGMGILTLNFSKATKGLFSNENLLPLNSTPPRYNFPTRSALQCCYSVAFLYFPISMSFSNVRANVKLLIIWDVSLFSSSASSSYRIRIYGETPAICINPALAYTHKFATLLFTTAWRNRQKSVCVEINFPLVHFRFHRILERCNECLSHKCTRDVKIVKLYSIKKCVMSVLKMFPLSYILQSWKCSQRMHLCWRSVS